MIRLIVPVVVVVVVVEVVVAEIDKTQHSFCTISLSKAEWFIVQC